MTRNWRPVIGLGGSFAFLLLAVTVASDTDDALQQGGKVGQSSVSRPTPKEDKPTRSPSVVTTPVPERVQRAMPLPRFVSTDGRLRFKVPTGWRAWDLRHTWRGELVELGSHPGGSMMVLIAEATEPFRPDCRPEPNTGDVEPYFCEWVTINASRWHEERKLVEGRNHVRTLTAVRDATIYRLIFHVGARNQPPPSPLLSSLRLR